MNGRNLLISAGAVLVLCVPVLGQTQQQSTPSTTPDKQPTVQQRKENQQDRIAQGVKSGQLTAGETKNIENKEAGINKEESNMRKADDGHLTAADRSKLNNQQNKMSNQIYRDKHNAAQQHYGNSEVGQRQRNQQQRIAQGIKSGQLTPRESAKLENQQQGVNREVKGMRQANGGKLSQADKHAVNQQQNRASKNIYNKKHNAAHTKP